MQDERLCGYPAPHPERYIKCNRPKNHDGPHRGDVNEDEVIFWIWGRPVRPLVRLLRDGQDKTKWVVDPLEVL